jgi:hypothetical protein
MRIVIALAVLASFPLYADVTIKSVVPAKNRIVIQSDDPLTVGQTVEATSEMEETCSLKVTKVSGKLAAVDTSQCSFAGEFKVGQSLSGGGGGGASQGGGSSHGGMKHYVGPTIYYSMASAIESTAQSGSTSVTVTDTATSALGIGGSYKLEIGSIGVQTGLMYEMPRTISERKLSNLSAVQRYNPAATLSMIVFEFNGSYAFGSFVPFFGFNYNMPTLTGAPTITIAGALGIQAGLQWKINNMFAVEAAYRTINFTVTEVGSAYDSSRLWGVMLRGIVYFGIF